MTELQATTDHLLVGVSGSIAILNLPTYLVAFRAAFAKEVRVIMTPGAAQLLPPATVALLCDEVVLDEHPREKRAGHVELANWADMFLVLPASANTLGQVANGLAQNLLTTTVLASPTPVIFCPNINETMWSKTAVQRNLRVLEEDGHIVVQPERAPAYEVGTGEIAYTRVLPEPDVLVEHLRTLVRAPSL